MGGDKATQERLQARADAAENERQAMMDEAINRTKVSTSILFKKCLGLSQCKFTSKKILIMVGIGAFVHNNTHMHESSCIHLLLAPNSTRVWNQRPLLKTMTVNLSSTHH